MAMAPTLTYAPQSSLSGLPVQRNLLDEIEQTQVGDSEIEMTKLNVIKRKL